MAIRGSAARRSPDNPLIGILRDLDRRTRSVEGRRRQPGPAGPAGPQGEQGRAGAAGGQSTVGVVVMTSFDGRGVWDHGLIVEEAPVIGALAVAPAPGEDTALTVTLEEVTATRVTVRVWRARPILGLGLLPSVPVGEGVAVHLTATRR